MAALIELLNYMDRQEDRKFERQQAEVRMEAYRRSQNAIAEREGKAMALRDNLTLTAKEIEAADLDLSRTQRQWFEARQKGQLSPQQDELYRNAVANAQANSELQKSKYRALTMERGHLDGSLDKTIAKTSEPMFGRIFDPKKDPYDQIQEERKRTVEDEATGETTEVTQKGPASAFPDANAYMPQFGQPERYTPPATATNLLGFTPSGFEADPEAVTPEISASSRDMGPSVYSKPQDQSPAISPTPMVSSDEKTEALNAFNSAQTPQAKQRIKQAAAARGIQIP